MLGWSLALWQFFFNPFPPAQALLSRHKPALALPHKPSLAVLPFATQDEGPQQRAFSSGLTEGLITSLSRVSGLFVAARNAPVLYQARDITPEQVGRELGVRYVLEGSVRRADDQVGLRPSWSIRQQAIRSGRSAMTVRSTTSLPSRMSLPTRLSPHSR